jgi:hypothetical protein
MRGVVLRRSALGGRDGRSERDDAQRSKNGFHAMID